MKGNMYSTVDGWSSYMMNERLCLGRMYNKVTETGRSMENTRNKLMDEWFTKLTKWWATGSTEGSPDQLFNSDALMNRKRQFRWDKLHNWQMTTHTIDGKKEPDDRRKYTEPTVERLQVHGRNGTLKAYILFWGERRLYSTYNVRTILQNYLLAWIKCEQYI